MGVDVQSHAPAALTAGKNPVPILQENVWAYGRLGRVWRTESLLVPPGFQLKPYSLWESLYAILIPMKENTFL
jgi:hypothetical protein